MAREVNWQREGKAPSSLGPLATSLSPSHPRGGSRGSCARRRRGADLGHLLPGSARPLAWPGRCSMGPRGLQGEAGLGPRILPSLSHGVPWVHPHPAPLSLCQGSWAPQRTSRPSRTVLCGTQAARSFLLCFSGNCVERGPQRLHIHKRGWTRFLSWPLCPAAARDPHPVCLCSCALGSRPGAFHEPPPLCPASFHSA